MKPVNTSAEQRADHTQAYSGELHWRCDHAPLWTSTLLEDILERHLGDSGLL
jgi:hypothetical protein